MARYVKREVGGVRWHAAEDFLPRIEDGPFRDFDGLVARAKLKKDLRHKRLVEFTEGEDTWLIKIYRDPGVVAATRRWVRGSKARLELKRSLDVMRRGISTVSILAVGERKHESYLVVEKLSEWRSLEEVLLSDEVENEDKRKLLFEFGRFSRQVHDAGIAQDDFNPGNVLVKPWGRAIEFKLIDFERATVQSTLSETARLRLVCKLAREQSVGRAKLLIFIDGYLHKYPDDQRREAEIIAIVQKYADELAELDRERTLQRCVEDGRNFGRFSTDDLLGIYRKARADIDRAGITEEEARRLEKDGTDYMRPRYAQAVHEWKQANLRAEEGGPIPYAVLWDKKGSNGFLAYRRDEIRERGLDWTEKTVENP